MIRRRMGLGYPKAHVVALGVVAVGDLFLGGKHDLFVLRPRPACGLQIVGRCFAGITSYFHDPAGTRWEPDTDYADETTRYTTPEHTWQHSMGDIVNALVAAGLRIDFLHEFSHCTWKVIAFTERAEGGGRRLPSRFPRLPMMFSLSATAPAVWRDFSTTSRRTTRSGSAAASTSPATGSSTTPQRAELLWSDDRRRADLGAGR